MASLANPIMDALKEYGITMLRWQEINKILINPALPNRQALLQKISDVAHELELVDNPDAGRSLQGIDRKMVAPTPKSQEILQRLADAINFVEESNKNAEFLQEKGVPTDKAKGWLDSEARRTPSTETENKSLTETFQEMQR